MARSSLLTASWRRNLLRWAKQIDDAFDTSTGHSHDGTDSRSVTATVTLDQAYDTGGAGAGRAITVDSGAVALTNNAANNNGVLTVEKSPAGAQSGNLLTLTMGANASGAALVIANSGSGNDVTGSAGWSVTKAGVGTFDSLAVGVIKFAEDVLGTGSCMIGRDNTGDTTVNALTGKQVHLAVNDVDVIDVGAAAVTIAQALTASLGITVSAGGITVTGNSTITGSLHVTTTMTVDGAFTFAGQVTASNGLDMNGTEIVLDVDGDTSITADTDDQIDFKVSGTDVVTITATVVDFNGLKLDLDANADTSITADTDDQIDIEIAGADDFQFTANTFTVLSGSTLTTAGTGSIVLVDNSLLALGTGSTARASYDTTDANANLVMLQLPAGGATDVPVVAIGQSIESVDLGATGVTYNGVVDPTIGVHSAGAVATAGGLRFYKSRGTVAAPTVSTTADDLGSISFYGGVANNEFVESVRIYAEIAGTIATTRGPGVLYIQTATDAAPSVLTTAVTISAAQLVTVATGLTATTGNITATLGNVVVTAGNLSFTAASDIIMAAATAAALEISDGTTKFYAFDTRVTTVGVTTHALDISDYTLASAAGAVATGLSLAAHNLNYTGTTQVTTQVDTVVLGSRTLIGAGAVTVDEANTLVVSAPTEGANITLTATAGLRILNAGGTPVNQYGIYIEDLTVGATLDVGIYLAGADSAAIYVAADPIHLADSVVMGFGSGTGVGAYDASITHNGTNLVVNPKVIGTGVLNVAGSVTVLGGEGIKSDSATEIGIQVANGSLTVGTLGSIVAPYRDSTDAAFSDAVGGNLDGSFGFQRDNDAGPILTLEARMNGAWVSVALAGTLIPARREFDGKNAGYIVHPGQLFEDGDRMWIDESKCFVCGEPMEVRDPVMMYANYRRSNGDLHAIYGHSHLERDEYVKSLEKRIKVLEAR